MGADVCIDIFIIIILYFIRIFYEIYCEAVPITNLPSGIIKNAIRSAFGQKCPFFVYDGTIDCSFSGNEEFYIAAGFGVPVNFLRRLEVYAPKHSIFKYLNLVGEQMIELTVVFESIVFSKAILLHSLLALLGKQILLVVLGTDHGETPTPGELLERFFRSSCVDRLLVIAMTSFTIDGETPDKPDSELLDALVIWNLLYLVFEHLSKLTVQRLDTITVLERTKEKQRSPVTDLRIIAVSFSCLLVSIIMVATSIFAVTISPLLAISMLFEALSLHSNWVFIFTWVLIRTFKNAECEEARKWLLQFGERTSHVADLSQFLYWSFLVISLFVINRKFLAFFFISRCTSIVYKLFESQPSCRLESLL